MGIFRKFISTSDKRSCTGRWRRFFNHDVVVAILIISLVLEVGAFFISRFAFKFDSMIGAILPSVVVMLTNDARTFNDQSPLTINMQLTRAAQNKANDMALKGYFSHVAPDGTLPWIWIKGAGYQYKYAGENLAVNFADSGELVQAWLASPEHRANILKSNYTEIGIGMATGTYQGKEAVFVVQYFATPSAVSATPAYVAAVSTVKEATDNVATGTAKIVQVDVSTTTTPVPAVLGVATQGPIPENIVVRALNIVVGSPITSLNVVLVVLFVFFNTMFIVGGMSKSRLSHYASVRNAFILFILFFGLVYVNKWSVFGSPLDIPSDARNAMVTQQ